MSRHHRSREIVYAILRSDDFDDPSVAIQDRVTVKAIVRTLAGAEAEVQRLNTLQQENDVQAHYWWQVTRLFSGDEILGVASDE